ncbi:histidinol-phosphatase [Clostridium perfringens]|nr:histidinol-phosphatase [Clostridium perfringens]
MRSNYHTHTYRCNHATGTIEDYVKEAIKTNMDEIGISDHLPHPGKNIDNYHRMAYEDLEDYFGKIEEAIEKYGDKISIKRSIECEYFPDFVWLYEELKDKYKADYLALGVHFFPYKGEWVYVGTIELTPEILMIYADFVVEAIKSGYFSYLAHPDLFGMTYKNWDVHAEEASKRILKAAEEMNMPIEINVNGMRKNIISYNNGERYQYPIKEFWELSKEYNVKRIVGIDAHNPEEMHDLDMGLNFAKEHDLSIIDRLEFNK